MVNSRMRRDVALLIGCVKGAINKSKEDYDEDYCRYPEWEDAVDKGRTLLFKIEQLEGLMNILNRDAQNTSDTFEAKALRSTARKLEAILF